MHLRSFQIRDFGPIRTLTWAPEGETAGWHVFIGENGAGKSTLLKALALAMLGNEGARGLRVAPRGFVREGAEVGRVQASWENGMSFSYDTKKGHPITLWGDVTKYQASFGAVRRFLGEGGRASSLRSDYPEVARHLSLFDEDWVLSEAISWLKDLKLDEGRPEPGRVTLRQIVDFLNHADLLPHGVRLTDVTSQGPVLRDAAGVDVGFRDLSDGYQSVLGLALELLRTLASVVAPEVLFGAAPDGGVAVLTRGVVLIDEIDAHLHPTWQQRIGSFFTARFPAMQFLVTSHSPLVCRAAERGSIFRLPRPGDSTDPGSLVTGVDRERLIYGDVLDAFGTEVFGAGVARSEQGRRKLERLGELNIKARFGQTLSEEERVEQRALRSIFTQAPLSPEDL